MSKTKLVLQKIVYAISTFIFGYILFVLFFVDRKEASWFYYSMAQPNWKLMIFIAIAAIIGRLAYKKLREETKGEEDVVNVVQYDRQIQNFMAILIVLQAIIIYSTYFEVGWDVRYLQDAARQFLDGGLEFFSLDYFATNSNNIGMFVINVVFLWIGDLVHINGHVLQVLFGIALCDVAIYLTTMIAWRLTRNAIAGYFAFFIMAVLIGLSPWIMVPYTDIFSIALPVITIANYISLREKEGKNICFRVFGIFAPATIGVLIKPTNIIIVIAIVIAEAIREKGHNVNNQKVAQIIMAIALCAGILIATKTIMYQAVGYEKNEAREKTMMHYMLLGSNTESGGCYNWDDDAYTDSFSSAAEKNEADWKLIKERYSNMGFGGFLYHITKKTDLNFNSGIFGWGKEVPFVAYKTREFDGGLKGFLQNLYYLNGKAVTNNENEIAAGFSHEFGWGGKYFELFALIEQMFWLFVLGSCFVSSVKFLFEKKESVSLKGQKERTLQLAITMAVVGIILFVSIFETNSRYLISYVPLFVLMTVIGYRWKIQ